MDFQKRDRALCLHAAAKRLQIPERTLRYRASRGRVEGAFKQGKLWKFWLSALEGSPQFPGSSGVSPIGTSGLPFTGIRSA